MIELRWVGRTHAPEHDGATGYTYKVLQYRYQIEAEKIHDIGKIHERVKAWSDWIDAPTVTEG